MPVFDEITAIKAATDMDGRLTAVVSGADVWGNAIAAEYRTDKSGCGLWEWNPKRRDWVQIVGTGQYAVRGPADLCRKLRAMLLPQ